MQLNAKFKRNSKNFKIYKKVIAINRYLMYNVNCVKTQCGKLFFAALKGKNEKVYCGVGCFYFEFKHVRFCRLRNRRAVGRS